MILHSGIWFVYSFLLGLPRELQRVAEDAQAVHGEVIEKADSDFREARNFLEHGYDAFVGEHVNDLLS